MMTKLQSALIVALLPLVAYAEPNEHGSTSGYRRRGEFYAKDLKQRLLREGHLTQKEAEIVTRTEVRVLNGWGINGFASWETENPKITIYAGTIGMFEWLSEAIVLAGEYNDETFAERYGRYIGAILDHNLVVSRTGIGTQRYGYPPAGAIRNGLLSSERIDVNQPFKPDAQRFRDSIVEASFVFLLFHEFGHLVLNHPKQTSSQSLQRKRELETEADRWAVKHALDCSFSVAVAFPMFALFGESDEVHEQFADHPAGQKRVKEALQQLITLLENGHPMATKYKNGGQYEPIMQDLKQKLIYMKKRYSRE